MYEALMEIMEPKIKLREDMLRREIQEEAQKKYKKNTYRITVLFNQQIKSVKSSTHYREQDFTPFLLQKKHLTRHPLSRRNIIYQRRLRNFPIPPNLKSLYFLFRQKPIRPVLPDIQYIAHIFNLKNFIIIF